MLPSVALQLSIAMASDDAQDWFSQEYLSSMTWDKNWVGSGWWPDPATPGKLRLWKLSHTSTHLNKVTGNLEVHEHWLSTSATKYAEQEQEMLQKKAKLSMEQQQQ